MDFYFPFFWLEIRKFFSINLLGFCSNGWNIFPGKVIKFHSVDVQSIAVKGIQGWQKIKKKKKKLYFKSLKENHEFLFENMNKNIFFFNFI